MPERRGKNTIRIARINRERGDALRIAQPKMRPRFSGICGLVNSVAHGKIRPRQTFTASHVNNVWVGKRHGYRPDRLRRLAVKDGIPRAPVVVGFPHSAVHRAHVKNVGLAGHAAGGARASAARGTNHAPAHFLVSGFGYLLRCSLIPNHRGKSNERKHETAR